MNTLSTGLQREQTPLRQRPVRARQPRRLVRVPLADVRPRAVRDAAGQRAAAAVRAVPAAVRAGEGVQERILRAEGVPGAGRARHQHPGVGARRGAHQSGQEEVVKTLVLQLYF